MYLWRIILEQILCAFVEVQVLSSVPNIDIRALLLIDNSFSLREKARMRGY
jgi:hypothetical protein